MKTFIKAFVWILIVLVVIVLFKFISDAADAQQANSSSWGIAKDNPIK